MAYHTTSVKTQAIKAKIITTDDYNLVGKIIIKSATSLGAIIPKCQHSVQMVHNVAQYIENSMKPGRVIEIEVHDASTDLDYARDIMISGYEQVELIESAWGQFATLIAREQIVNNLSKIREQIKVIYEEATNNPSIVDTKQALWDYYQVESEGDRQKFGAYVLKSMYESITKYESLIEMYAALSRNPLNSSSYIAGVLNVLREEELRSGIPAMRQPSPLGQRLRQRFGV